MKLSETGGGHVGAPDRTTFGQVAKIDRHLNFEILIERISSRLANVGWETDAALDAILAQLGAFLAVDRVTLIDVGNEIGSLTPIRQWFAEGIEPDDSVRDVDVSAQFRWLTEVIAAGEPVAINNLDDFPDSASNERAYCEQMGIQAFTMVPASLDGNVVAALALDSIRTPRVWDKPLLERLKLVAEIVASTSRRIHLQQGLIELRNFEKAAFELSTKFVNLPAEQIDAEIEEGLGAVAAALDVQLITMAQVSGDRNFVVTHEWSCDQIAGPRFKGTSVSEKFPWLAARLRNGKPLSISTLSDFPSQASDEIAAMNAAGHRSVLFVPFDTRGQMLGYLAIDSIKERAWSDNLVSRLQLLGEVFGEALHRGGAELELRRSYSEIEALKEKLQQENVYLRQEFHLDFEHGDIIGNSEPLRDALQKAEQVAQTESTVLILGETGTGKELLARAIHNLSPRRDNLMVTVNCAALPSSLVEAELFGREKGAFTGALTREAGRFEIANGSTILLDEIGELPLDLQAKLLRVIETGEFERLGSSKKLKVDVRILASTNRDLAADVKDKTFREDLYYRLNVFPIEMPPLRDRIGDIPQLVWTFVQDFSNTMGKNIESIPARVMDALVAYGWPGNVREVKNIVERAMIVSQGPVLEIELPGVSASTPDAKSSSRRLLDVEREHIKAVVDATGWRIRGSGGAAEILGLKPTTLEARMKKLGLERPS